MASLLADTLDDGNLFRCEIVELIHHLVNLALKFLDSGLLGEVGEIVLVFGDGEDLINYYCKSLLLLCTSNG